MSAQEQTNILLPNSQVDIFVINDEIFEKASVLDEDWRFARVSVHVEKGGVDDAIAAYKKHDAPNIIIIQTDDISEAFTERLEELSAYCDEDTQAIVVGPVNDVDLYRQLIDMGVSDYLVSPFESETVLADVIAKGLITQIGIVGSTMITYCGAKGGVGTSVLAQAAAWVSARVFKQKTILLDAAGGWSSNSVGMGFEPGTTLTDVIHAIQDEDEDSLSRMIVKKDERLFVLSTGSDQMLSAPPEERHIETLLNYVMARYPVVIADGSGATPDVKKMFIRRASQVNLIASAGLAALRLVRVLHSETKRLRGGDEDYVETIVNMAGQSKAHEASLKDIEEALERKISAYIPYDTKGLMTAENDEKPFLDIKEAAMLAEKYIVPLLIKVIAKPSGKDAEDNSPKGGIMDKLIGALKE